MGAFLFGLGIAAAAAVWKGVVLSLLWFLFVTPAFNIEAPNIIASAGIATMVEMLTARFNKDSEAYLVESIKFEFKMPLYAGILGFVLSLFI